MAQKMVAQRFQIETLIGGGAIGSVYRGTDTLTGEQVAIKVLRKELTADMPELIERFRREGEALRRLNHPNIVRMLGMVEEEKQHYLIMEYAGGGSLAGLLKRQPQLPLVQAAAIALELADALSRAHHLEILHRDIKPDNILLAEDGTPRLTDFGLARLGNYPAITTAGSVLGTFQYLSPEAFYNQSLDPRADIWSLGVVLYEMLTGQVPFSGGTPGEILWAINNQPLPDPNRWREDIPATLAELLKSMLMRDRSLRIASARRVGAELERIRKVMQKPGGLPLSEPGPRQFEQASASFEAKSPSPKKIRVLIADDHAVAGAVVFIRTLVVRGSVVDLFHGLRAGQIYPELDPGPLGQLCSPYQSSAVDACQDPGFDPGHGAVELRRAALFPNRYRMGSLPVGDGSFGCDRPIPPYPYFLSRSRETGQSPGFWPRSSSAWLLGWSAAQPYTFSGGKRRRPPAKALPSLIGRSR